MTYCWWALSFLGVALVVLCAFKMRSWLSRTHHVAVFVFAVHQHSEHRRLSCSTKREVEIALKQRALVGEKEREKEPAI